LKTFIYTIFISIFLISLSYGQGRYAGASMELGIGARPLALGGAAAAMTSTGETFYYNPASLGLAQKVHVNFMYAPTFGSFSEPMANYNYLGGMYPMPGG